MAYVDVHTTQFPPGEIRGRDLRLLLAWWRGTTRRGRVFGHRLPRDWRSSSLWSPGARPSSCLEVVGSRGRFFAKAPRPITAGVTPTPAPSADIVPSNIGTCMMAVTTSVRRLTAYRSSAAVHSYRAGWDCRGGRTAVRSAVPRRLLCQGDAVGAEQVFGVVLLLEGEEPGLVVAVGVGPRLLSSASRKACVDPERRAECPLGSMTGLVMLTRATSAVVGGCRSNRVRGAHVVVGWRKRPARR
jgi:hypothetical protein